MVEGEEAAASCKGGEPAVEEAVEEDSMTVIDDSITEGELHTCPAVRCNSWFTRRQDLDEHMLTEHMMPHLRSSSGTAQSRRSGSCASGSC